MHDTPERKFLHRTQDGLIQSICTKCFKTVAVRKNEPQLQEDEAAHHCQRSPWETPARKKPDTH